MEYWEFLLQKEGDQAWLPLESSQVEVLEGRYRIMVHTSHHQVPVQIRISQLLQGQDGSKRRVLKRQGAINENGLMVVIPFTWLQVGTWQINCTVLSEDEPPVEARQYAVQLQVLSHDNLSEDDWITDPWTEDVPPPPAADKLSESALAAVFRSIDRALAETITDEETQASRGLALSSQYRIELAQSALVANQGALTVMGKVSMSVENFPESAVIALRLSDPQSGQELMTRQQSIFQPSAFAIPISLPPNLTTRLLLGEVALVTHTERVLAVQRFTVTVDLSSLIDAIANQGETFDEFNIVFPDGETPQQPPDEPHSTDMPPPPRRVPTLLMPRDGTPLPPKIYYPTTHEATVHRPTLPPLQTPLPPPPKNSEAAQSATDAMPSGDDTAEGHHPPPSSPRSLELPAFVLQPPAAPTPPTAPTPEEPAAPDSPAGEPTAPDSFKDLNLQDRFWLRLNALATESHEASLQKQAEAAAANLHTPPPEATPTATPNPFAGEVVIYEDNPAPPSAEAPAPPSQDEPVSPPTPIIELSTDELVAGETFYINLRTAIHFNRLYLRVWITDPQSRTLADEPRQIMQLSPDGYGNLHATVQMQVPQGCLEAQIEAIAVDMVTQQESYKASVLKSVLPENVKRFDGL